MVDFGEDNVAQPREEGKIRRLNRKLEKMAQNRTGFYANKERK